ncbi:hypothetical protein R1sor_003921 [Riccia sorocarpa]|uniref:PsbP C-terminal domain-containing protein n=1 Tax=Riccia sorocarpa TaxID=122646 RepID=A0ABD3H6Y5_9MARC
MESLVMTTTSAPMVRAGAVVFRTPNVLQVPESGSRGNFGFRSGLRVRAEKAGDGGAEKNVGVGKAISRRDLFAGLFVVATGLPFVQNSPTASATTSFRQYKDRFDGYSFKYPEGWIQVRGAGADVFFRDPVNLDENVVVEFSSPSSSRYKSVEDLGTPEEAAQRALKQYLTEFMSTRLGVRREADIVSSKSRIGPDGRLYYDVEVNVKSYANTNQLAVMPQDRVAKLEWSRRYLSAIGVENSRLYELRLQAPERVLMEEESDLRQMMESFQLQKIEE